MISKSTDRRLISILLSFLLIMQPFFLVRAEGRPDIPEDVAEQNPEVVELSEIDNQEYYDEYRADTISSLTPTPPPSSADHESSTTTPSDNTSNDSSQGDGQETPQDTNTHEPESSASATDVDVQTGPTPPADTDSTINSGDNNSQASTERSQSNTTIKNNNDADVDHEVDVTATSGNNELANLINDVKTGDAGMNVDIANQLNTNIVGTNFNGVIITEMGDHNSPIDLSYIRPCDESYRNQSPTDEATDITNTGDQNTTNISDEAINSTDITNNNDARIVNNIDAAAITGENNAKGIVNLVDTGDADVDINVFNMANTNLVGDCFFFGVINVFGDQVGDIILPYELGFVQSTAPAQKTPTPPILIENSGNNNDTKVAYENENTFEVNNNDDALVTTNIEAHADTGKNTSTGGYTIMETGMANIEVNQLDKVNTSIVGNNFLFLLVNTQGEWNGSITGPPAQYALQPNFLILWYPTLPLYGALGPVPIMAGTLPVIPGVPTPYDPVLTAQDVPADTIQNSGDDNTTQITRETKSTTTVNNSNTAVVENNITASADTGHNTTDGRLSSVKTGNASILINVLNLVNTNITGRNWFFGMISVFGDFLGDVVFPRPDMEIVNVADKDTAAPGELVLYNLRYRNTGQLFAQEVVLTDTLPEGASFVSASDDGIYTDGRVSWNLEEMASGQSGEVTVLARIDERAPTGITITNNAHVATETDEPNTTNNDSSATVDIVDIQETQESNTGGQNQDSTFASLNTHESDTTASTVNEESKSTDFGATPSRQLASYNQPPQQIYYSSYDGEETARVLSAKTSRRLITINRSFCSKQKILCALFEIIAIGGVVYGLVRLRKRTYASA